MKLKKIILASIITLATSNYAIAETGFTGSGESALTNTTGNAEKESLYAALKLGYEQKSYQIKGLIEANNDKQNDIRTKERYVIDIQADRKFSSLDGLYSFAQARLENDRFVQIDTDRYFLLGMGYNFLKGQDKKLIVETGLGVQQVDYYYTPGGAEDFSQTTLKVALDFEYPINETVKFIQNATEYYGDDQSKFESNSAISVKMAESLNLNVTYKYRKNENPAEGKKKEDGELVIGFIYGF